MKKSVRYFLFLIILVILYLLAVKLNFYHYSQTRTDFALNFNRLIFINLISCGPIGFLLGFESFLNEYRKSGGWNIDVPRLIILCLPFLLLSAMPILIFNFGIGRLPIVGSIIITDNKLLSITIFNILFGYFLITSFYKK
ncbi:hypothetical protein [Clostridioides sp. ZZV15-6598]|uniref:hypothetical protein n=1 Tax=Clostridioides sp. ZZV15-6598 TaxID=2811501 RepID=UPI001D0F767F